MKSTNRLHIPNAEIRSPINEIRLAQRLAAIQCISQRVLSLRDVQDICQAVCDGCVEELGYQMAWVGLVDRQQPGVVRPIAHSGATDLPGTGQLYTETGFFGEPRREEAQNQGYPSRIAFPLRNSDAIIGALNLYADEWGAFREEDVLVASMLAAHAATAVANAHRLQAECRQRQMAEMLRDLVVTVNSTLEVDQVLNIAVRRLQGLFQASASSVSFLEEDGETFVFQTSTDPGFDISQHITFPAQRSIAGRAIREREVQLDNNLDLSLDFRAEVTCRTDIVGRSMLAAPLFVDDKPVGVIQVLHASPDAFTQVDVELLDTTARLIETAIAHAQAYSQAVRLAKAEHRQREVAETLRQVANLINSSLDLNIVLDRVLEQLAQVVAYDRASLMLLKDEKLTTRAVRGFDEPDQSDTADTPLFQEMLESCRPIVIRDTMADGCHWPWPGSELVRSWIGVPLMVQNRVIGQLTVAKHQPDSYDQGDVDLMFTFAQQVAIAIENAHLHAETQQRAQQLAVLHELDRAIAASLRVDDVYYAFARHAGRLLPYDHMSITLLEGTQIRETYVVGEDKMLSTAGAVPPVPGQAAGLSRSNFLARSGSVTRCTPVTDRPGASAAGLHPEASWSVWRTGEAAQTSAVGWVAMHGQPLVRHNLAAGMRFAEDEQLVASGIQSSMIIPLRVKGRVTGTWNIASRQVATYSPDELAIAQSMADQLAAVIENTRLYRAVQDYAAELEDRVKARTAELERERERLLAVLECAGDAIVIAEREGSIEYANPAWERLTGFSAQEVLGQSQHILQIGQASPEAHGQLWSTVQSGRVWRGDLVDRRRDGSRFEVQVTIAPVTSEGEGVVNFVGVFHDVTQIKKLARLKDEFLNTAAHELRTPITSIMGFNELLLTRKNLSEEQRTRYLGHISDQTARLKQIVDDLLDISQMESGAGFTIEREPLDLYPLLEQVIQDWEGAHPDHIYRLQISRDDWASYPSASVVRVTGVWPAPRGQPVEAGPTGLAPDWPKVCADQNRVRQVMYHLLSNATRYSPSGSTITVKASPVGGYVEVIVADEGIGMTEEELSHIFEKFWRGDASSTAIEGTGLGLTVAKHIVEQHEGHIWVESAKGEGTAVHFTLPLLDRRAIVLIVEDEGPVRDMEQSILSTDGIATLVVSRGQESIEIARACQPGLILLDLTLPDKPGKEVLQALKAHPATAHIPILVVSTRLDWPTIEESQMLGALDFLKKPFEREELLGRVRRGLYAWKR